MRLGLGVAALSAGVGLLGCNAITGVGDLRFGEGSGGRGGMAGVDAGVSAGGGAGGTGGRPAHGGAASGGAEAAGGAGPECGLTYTDQTCEACVVQQCCAKATACAKNAECDSLRSCRRACADETCREGCYAQHQCGVRDWLTYLDCTNTKCDIECSGVAPDAGKGSSGDAAASPQCQGSPCDPVQQCGCGGGQTCVVGDSVSGATVCIVPGTTPEGSTCSRSADCAAGTGCVDGVCKRFCRDNSDCPRDGYCYEIVHDGPGCTAVPTPVWGYCRMSCDPVDPTPTCGAGVTCSTYSLDAGGTQATDCKVGGRGEGPAACSKAANDSCSPGYVCVHYSWGTTDSFNCSSWCKVGLAQGCSSDETCIPFADAVTLGGTTYGYCAKQCDLLNPAGVCGNGACRSVSLGNGDSTTDCFARTGNGVGPDGCASDRENDCAQTYDCVSYSGSYTCEKWCTPANPDCPAGTSCSGTPFPVNGATYSTCH